MTFNKGPDGPNQITAEALHLQLLVSSFPYFMSWLRDTDGQFFQMARHQQLWADLFATHARLAILAPRDHGKSTLGLCFVLWQFYRHARDTQTGLPLAVPRGTYSAVLFSATRDQADVHMARFRDLLAANAELFGLNAGVPKGDRSARGSAKHVRLATGAELRSRAYRTATRGLHPHLLLLDDVGSDENSANEYQRRKTWQYLTRTLLPMHADRMIIIGTAIHYDDLIHRLEPLAVDDAADEVEPERRFGFAWFLYKALDEDTRTTLWPDRHPYSELEAIRAEDPTMFSREYQNDPRDDVSSLFPHELTQRAIDAGAGLRFVPFYRHGPNQLVVMGMDLARSEVVGADYTVAIVAVVDPSTGCLRVLTARRHRGLDFNAQLNLAMDLCRSYEIDAGIVEQNTFQRFLLDELHRLRAPTKILGHTTGQQKTNIEDGIPIVKLALLSDRWIMPSGDAESRRFAALWQAELGAFGWRDGRLQGSGEHDDTVFASWFLELAYRYYRNLRPPDEIIRMEDLGIEPVTIGEPYPTSDDSLSSDPDYDGDEPPTIGKPYP